MILNKIKALLGVKPAFPNGQKKTGTLKYFNRKRGFGFIDAPHSPKDIFVHVTEIKEHIQLGDEVEFEIQQNEKGLVAKNVERVNGQ